MKIKLYLCAAFIAAFSLNGVAYASHQSGHPAAPQARSTGNATATAADDTPMAPGG